MPSQKVVEMIQSIKKRFSGVSGKTCNRINQSSLVLNLKCAIQSTPDLLKMKAHPNQNSSTPDISRLAPSDFHRLGSDDAFSPLCTVVDDTASFPSCLKNKYSQGSMSTTATRILFSPSKEAIAYGSGKKLRLKFALKKNNWATELPAVKGVVSNLPMITLTVPDDEQIYMLHRPIPPISSDRFLAVPTRSCSTKNNPEPQKFSHKRWPHPAGPWLRLTTVEKSGFEVESEQLDWSEGWRLGTGRVIGWDPECIEALGIPLPPQLPTEQDLKTMALVEQISKSLDQAQDALYGDLDGEWECDEEEDDYKPKAFAPSWMFPPCIEVLERA